VTSAGAAEVETVRRTGVEGYKVPEIEAPAEAAAAKGVWGMCPASSASLARRREMLFSSNK
jgi:hypothetical protein